MENHIDQRIPVIFLHKLAQEYGIDNIKIVPKDKSLLMKFTSLIINFFNKEYMDSFVTTIGKTIYIPRRLYNDLLNNQSQLELMEIFSHELQHIYDNKKLKFLFPILYLFPQILSVLFLLSILAIYNIKWIFCLLFLFFLLPIPSPTRYRLELNGYITSLIFAKYIYAGLLDMPIYQTKHFIAQTLSSNSYYFCNPNYDKIMKDLENDQELINRPRYQKIIKVLKEMQIIV